MAGAGFDARMISGASRKMKARFGRAAYLYSGARNLAGGRAKVIIDVDGRRFFRGRVSSVLVGNVGTILGGLEVFTGAQPDDGRLELGVITARNPADWARVTARVVAVQPGKSPFVQVTSGKRLRIRFSQPFPYELDGGARGTADKLRVKVHPASLRICGHWASGHWASGHWAMRTLALPHGRAEPARWCNSGTGSPSAGCP
jgi:diacylglycerol kinase (ATP)